MWTTSYSDECQSTLVYPQACVATLCEAEADDALALEAACVTPADVQVPLYDSTFSRTVWRLYGGSKGLVMWYLLLSLEGNAVAHTLQGCLNQLKSKIN